MIYGTYYVCRLIALLDNDAPRGFQIDFNSDLPVLQFDVEWWGLLLYDLHLVLISFQSDGTAD